MCLHFSQNIVFKDLDLNVTSTIFQLSRGIQLLLVWGQRSIWRNSPTENCIKKILRHEWL
jgi:hypothetical protein